MYRGSARACADERPDGWNSAVSLRHSGKIEIPVDKPIVIEKVIPDFTGYPKRMLTGLLDRKDLNIVIKGEQMF